MEAGDASKILALAAQAKFSFVIFLASSDDTTDEQVAAVEGAVSTDSLCMEGTRLTHIYRPSFQGYCVTPSAITKN